MKNILLNCFFIAALFSHESLAKETVDMQATAEREQIAEILKEITYLKEVVIQMEQRFGTRNDKIRFNYQALLVQLTATENGIREYLNARVDQIYLTPPAALNQQLFNVRKN